MHIDDDVITAARSLARVPSTTIGKVVSDLARTALQQGKETAPRNYHGVPLFPRSNADVAVTLQLVNQIRDDL